MNRMNNRISFIVAAFFIAGMFSTSCERGTTLGAVGYPDPNDPLSFDTFNVSTADFFFYGKFEGQFRVWEDGKRSKWDTITRLDINDPNATTWSLWPAYSENIYRNIPRTNLAEMLPCINDSDNIWFDHTTRFLRPEIPNERIEISFFDCIEEYDTIPANLPFNDNIVTYLGIADYGTAIPFTNTEYGRRGVQLKYVDENRDVWTTKTGSGQLVDSYFRLNEFYPRIVSQDTLDTLAMHIIEGEFAGRLYNGSRELPITEAKFRARLVPRSNF